MELPELSYFVPSILNRTRDTVLIMEVTGVQFPAVVDNTARRDNG